MKQRVRLTTYVDPEISAEVERLAGKSLTPSRMAEILLSEALEARSQGLAGHAQESNRPQAGQTHSASHRPSAQEPALPSPAR